MQAVLSKVDYESVRTLLRWTGVGVQPSVKRSQSVLELLRGASNEAFAPIEKVIEEIGRGVMVSQDACNVAQEQLLQFHLVDIREDSQPRPDNQNG